MKILFLVSIFIVSIFAFEVKFTDEYQKNISVSTNAFLLKTDKSVNKIPFEYFKLKNKYIIIGDGEVDEWIRNSAILPADSDIEETKVGILNIDKLRMKIINRLNKNYKNCNLKKINFLNSPKKIYLKPRTIKIKTEVILECK